MNDESAKDAPLSDEERARALREQLKQVHAFDLAFEMAVSLVSFGYQKLGLTAETRELRDLGDARVAIELLRAELDVLSRELGEARLGDLRATLAQLQLSYARAVGAGGEGAGAASGDAATPETPADEPSAQVEEPQGSAAASAGSEPPAVEDGAPATPEERPADEGEPEEKTLSTAGKQPASAKAAARKKSATKKKPAARREPPATTRAARRKRSAGAKDEPVT